MTPWSLQQAIFAALSGDAAVTALVGARIFDGVPETAALPYIVLGDATENDSGAGLSRHELRLTLWSRSGGTRENKQIAAAIRTCLETAVADGLIDLRFVSAEYSRQSEAKPSKPFCALPH